MPTARKKKRSIVRIVTYDSLWESWWEIHDGYLWCRDETTRGYLVTIAFEALLKQTGWTIERWNAENSLNEK